MKKILVVAFILITIPLAAVYADEATSTSSGQATTTPETSTSTLPTLPDPVPINLQVEGPTKTIFDASITVSACITPNNATPTVNGFCAFESAALAVDATWFSFGALINSIEGISGDSSNFWLWFLNGDVALVGIDSYILKHDDHVLWVLERQPTKISASETSPEVGETSTISVTGFDPIEFSFVPLSEALLEGIDATTSESGTFDLIATSTEPLTIRATKDGYLTSEFLTITALATGTSTESAPPTPPSSGGGDSQDDGFDVPAALTFLANEQEADGSFGEQLFTDWIAIAFVAAEKSGHPVGNSKTLLKNHLLSTTPSLSSVTDYERHAMALMALGIDPYSGTAIDYIARIVQSFDGAQIGDPALDNDDIFALFPLLHAGYNVNGAIIQKIAGFILSQQKPNGSWDESSDMTAAAIQALGPLYTIPGLNAALGKAAGYLKSQQKPDGGWGNIDSTSWVKTTINGIIEAHTPGFETESVWKTSLGYVPSDALARAQQSDGGVLSPSNRVWSTAYAVTAASGKSWVSVLQSFTKKTTESATSGGEGGGNESTSVTTSSSTSLSQAGATSTAPSTPIVLGVATTGSSSPLVLESSSQPTSEPSEEVTTSTTSPTTSAQFASAAESVSDASSMWLWLAGLLIIFGGFVYFFLRRA